MSLNPLHIESACTQLIASYSVENWWPAESLFEVLIGAVLVQNTRWANAEKAIRHLHEHQCLNPVGMSLTDLIELQALIRPAGCQSVKALRLKSLASWVVASGGLEALEELPTSELRSMLLKVHGIGEETADAILCFGFERRVFIADKYARLWLSRMGFVSESAAGIYASCRKIMERVLADTNICMQDLHAAIVIHAQRICRPEPQCSACALTGMCSYGFS